MPQPASSYFLDKLSELVNVVDQSDATPDGERPAVAGPVANLVRDLSSTSVCTGDELWLALHETQAAEVAQRNEVQASRRREDEVLQELRSVVQSQSELTKLLNQEQQLLHSERAQTATLRAQLERVQSREQQQLELHATLQEQWQQIMHENQSLVCQLKDKEKQLVDCQKSSSAQTAALIEQENIAAVLSNKLVSTEEELRSAQQLILDFRTQSGAQQPDASLCDAGRCKDSTEAPHNGVHSSPTLHFAEIRAEMTQIDSQLRALASENGYLRTARRNLQECLWQVQSENAALKHTVARLRSNSSSTPHKALSFAVHTDQNDLCPPSQACSTVCAPMNTPVLDSGGSMHSNSRALFHWSGVDFCKVTKQRDQAVCDMTDMSFELEKARCELRTVHAELRKASDKEDEAMLAKTQLNMVLLQRARAMAIAQGAGEQLADVESMFSTLNHHLSRWQQGYIQMLQHMEAEQKPSSANANTYCESSDILCLRSQIMQDEKDMQKMAARLQNFDAGTTVIHTELEELRMSECQGVCGFQAPSTERYSSEQRRLYQLSCQRLETIQGMQKAACRSRAALVAVLGRLVHGAVHKDSHLLRTALNSWRICVARKLVAAHLQQLRATECQVSIIQERFEKHSYALFQIQTHKHDMGLKRTLFISWNRQLWLSRVARLLWQHIFTLTIKMRSEDQHVTESIAARHARRRRLCAAGQSSVLTSLPDFWTVRATFLCWKSCAVASRMENEAFSEMHAVEKLSSSLAVRIQCAEARQLVQRVWFGWRKYVLGIALSLVQRRKEDSEPAVPEQDLSEAQQISVVEADASCGRSTASSALKTDLHHGSLVLQSPSYEKISEQPAVSITSPEEDFKCIGNSVQGLPGGPPAMQAQTWLHSTAKGRQLFGVLGWLAIACMSAAGLGVDVSHVVATSWHRHDGSRNSANMIGQPCHAPQPQGFATFQAENRAPQPLQCTVESPTPDILINDCPDSTCAALHDPGQPHLMAEDSAPDYVPGHNGESDSVVCQQCHTQQPGCEMMRPCFQDHPVVMAEATVENHESPPQVPCCELHQSASRDKTVIEQQTSSVTPAPSKGMLCAEERLASGRDTKICKRQPRPQHAQSTKRRVSVMHTASRRHKKGACGKPLSRQGLSNSTSAHVWKPTSKFPALRQECPVTSAHSRLQGTKIESAGKAKNVKEIGALQGAAAGTLRTKLKGSSRMPLLKKWDSEDFAAAKRLGFSLRGPVAMHGKQSNDGSVTNTWTTEVSGVQEDYQVGTTCVEDSKEQDSGCDRSHSNKAVPPKARSSKQQCSKWGSPRISLRSHTTDSPHQKHGISDPCTPTANRRGALLRRYCAEKRQPKIHKMCDSHMELPDGQCRDKSGCQFSVLSEEPSEQNWPEGRGEICTAEKIPESALPYAASRLDSTEEYNTWGATRQPEMAAVKALNSAVEHGHKQVLAVRSLRHTIEKSTLRRVFSVKFNRDGNVDPETASSSPALAFQVGDIRRKDSVQPSPWSGFAGKTFSSHVKQAAPHQDRAAASNGTVGLLDPTGDTKVRLADLTSSSFSPVE